MSIIGNPIIAGGAPVIIPLSATANGTYTAPTGVDGYSPVTVNVPTGGGSTDSGVIFIDYDGSIVESWGASEVASKTALPTNPSHPDIGKQGLIALGWNRNLSEIKDYIENYPTATVVVGQMYKTSSGLTEFDITLTKVTGLNVTCGMAGNKNWGDDTTDALTSHTYADYGDYTITCAGTSVPAFVFGSNYTTSGRYIGTGVRLGENVTSIGDYAFYYCYSLTSITIPDGVTSIGDYAFSNCYSLTSINIPDGVTRIGINAFSNCYSLTSITIPDGVTSIGNNAFYYCYSLTSINIPDGVTSIGDYAFYHCYSLTSINIPDGVTSIGSSTFSSCYSLTSITIPDGVTSIGNNAFYYCYSLTSITIPDGVTSIGSDAFSNCYSLTSINIPDGVTSIGDYAFYYCYSLTSINIPDGVTRIGNSAFSNCYSLTSINIPDGVTSIGDNAFYHCYSLTSINIPDGVTSIGTQVFISCPSITKYDFTAAAAVPTLANTNAFGSINGICKIVVPDTLYDTWIAATNWSAYAIYIYKASEVAE